jgi:hypothetical protein
MKIGSRCSGEKGRSQNREVEEREWSWEFWIVVVQKSKMVVFRSSQWVGYLEVHHSC